MNDTEERIKSFTDLKTWREGHQLVLLVYGVTKTFPREELYSLVDQMRRAAISVTSNIAEGFGRQTYKEKLHFYFIAQGSLTELKNQIIIARDLGYLSGKDLTEIAERANASHQLLQGLIRKSKEILYSGS